VIISDDFVRGRSDLSVEDRSKPSGMLMKIALENSGDTTAEVYIGDDPVKDGKLAENYGVLFWWFISDIETPRAQVLPKDTLAFTNWHMLIKKINKSS